MRLIYPERRWRSSWALIAGFFITLALVACGGGPSASTSAPAPTATATATFANLFTPRYSVAMRPDVAYGSAPLETLDLCAPDHPAAPLPGIVLIHGGSSTVGDKRDEFDV